MNTFVSILSRTASLSQWFWTSRRANTAKTTKLTEVSDLPAESPKDIKTLLTVARESGSLHDLENFLLAAKKENLQVVLTLELDSVSVVSGRIESTRLDSDKLIIEFERFNSLDRDYGRIIFNKVTNGNWRNMQPMHMLYFSANPIFEISSKDYKVKGIYLISGLPENKVEIV